MIYVGVGEKFLNMASNKLFKQTIILISLLFLFAGISTAQRLPEKPLTVKTTFKDPRDGRVYGIKRIGSLTWMKENLNFDMPEDSLCYENDDEACSELGMLYTFEGALKACPTGWRLPTDNDWMDLERTLGMSQNQLVIDGYTTPRGSNEAQRLKTGGTSGLNIKISGFAMLGKDGPEFGGIGDDRPRSYFWTSTGRTIKNIRNVFRRRIEAKNGYIYRFSNPADGYAISVRCVQ